MGFDTRWTISMKLKRRVAGMDLSLIPADRKGPASNSGQHMVVFRVDDLTLALPEHSVIGFVEQPDVTPIPLTPSYVSGLFEFKGEALTLFSLRQRLGLTPDSTEMQRIGIILNLEDVRCALLVDEIIGIVAVDNRAIEARPSSERGMIAWFCSGSFVEDEETIRVLDTKRMFASDNTTDAVSVTGSPTPRLRLVKSAATGDKAEKPGSSVSVSLIGGSEAIRRIANIVSYKIFDDDMLNPFLGSMDAMLLPGLIAKYLTGFLSDDPAAATEEIQATIYRLVREEGFDRSHFDHALTHLTDALSIMNCSEDAIGQIVQRVELCWPVRHGS